MRYTVITYGSASSSEPCGSDEPTGIRMTVMHWVNHDIRCAF